MTRRPVLPKTSRSICFRQQLLPSTSGSARILESPVQRLRDGVILLMTNVIKCPKMGSLFRFRQQLSISTSGSRPDPSIPGQVFLGRRFSPVPERPGFQENAQTAKGTHKRCPYTYGSFRNRVKDAQNGPIRFRQQLLPSTPGNTLILEFL